MDYQLALKLKAAGFPQGPNPAYNVEEMTHVRCPNLEEVIAECGEDFRMILLHTQYTKKLDRPWEAVPNKKRRPDIKGQKAPTPLEAVSNLYIALKQK